MTADDERTRRPAPWPDRLAELLHARPELRGVGITDLAEPRWTS